MNKLSRHFYIIKLPGLDKVFDNWYYAILINNLILFQTNKHGEGAIHVAAGLGQLEILKILASKGGNLVKFSLFTAI